MSNFYVKSGGVWKTPKNIYVKNSGVWYPVKNLRRKEGGTWIHHWPSTYNFGTAGEFISNIGLQEVVAAQGWSGMLDLAIPSSVLATGIAHITGVYLELDPYIAGDDDGMSGSNLRLRGYITYTKLATQSGWVMGAINQYGPYSQGAFGPYVGRPPVGTLSVPANQLLVGIRIQVYNVFFNDNHASDYRIAYQFSILTAPVNTGGIVAVNKYGSVFTAAQQSNSTLYGVAAVNPTIPTTSSATSFSFGFTETVASDDDISSGTNKLYTGLTYALTRLT